ncbi:MAG: hypothetical protein Q4C77_13710 [Eubacteriales bacterium]|nr:hypothetical protein [Eubacteriales bacterium]
MEKMMKMRTIIMSITAMLLAVCLSGCSIGQDSNKSDITIKDGMYRKIVYSLISSAENSSLDKIFLSFESAIRSRFKVQYYLSAMAGLRSGKYQLFKRYRLLWASAGCILKKLEMVNY